MYFECKCKDIRSIAIRNIKILICNERGVGWSCSHATALRLVNIFNLTTCFCGLCITRQLFLYEVLTLLNSSITKKKKKKKWFRSPFMYNVYRIYLYDFNQRTGVTGTTVELLRTMCLPIY